MASAYDHRVVVHLNVSPAAEAWAVAGDLRRLSRQLSSGTSPAADESSKRDPANHAFRKQIEDEAAQLLQTAQRLRRAATLYQQRQNPAQAEEDDK